LAGTRLGTGLSAAAMLEPGNLLKVAHIYIYILI
jgi:hypothetical protein